MQKRSMQAAQQRVRETPAGTPSAKGKQTRPKRITVMLLTSAHHGEWKNYWPRPLAVHQGEELKQVEEI